MGWSSKYPLGTPDGEGDWPMTDAQTVRRRAQHQPTVETWVVFWGKKTFSKDSWANFPIIPQHEFVGHFRGGLPYNHHHLRVTNRRFGHYTLPRKMNLLLKIVEFLSTKQNLYLHKWLHYSSNWRCIIKKYDNMDLFLRMRAEKKADLILVPSANLLAVIGLWWGIWWNSGICWSSKGILTSHIKHIQTSLYYISRPSRWASQWFWLKFNANLTWDSKM